MITEEIQVNVEQQNQLSQQIDSLQTEITTRRLDIQNLQEALDTLIAGKPRPANPESDNAFEMLKQLVGSVPETLEEQRIYEAKLQEAERSLRLAIAVCEEKELGLGELQQKQRKLQAEELFEQVKVKGERFNACVSEVVKLLDEIKQTSNQISALRGDSCLTGVYFEKRELPWCVTSDRTLVIRRKFEVKP